jgi:hypothetical protein
MKTEMIIAFKKKLSQINDYNDIDIKYSTEKYYGGYSDFKFHNFNLSQMMHLKDLSYKNTRYELTHEEWLELRGLVIEKKALLQKTTSCKDYLEIMEIINS